MKQIPDHALFELLRGATSPEAVAQAHGVSVAEVEACRDGYVRGLATTSRGGRWRRVGWSAAVLAAATLGLVSTQALSQVACTQPAAFTNLGLKYFCADTPALASEVNTNTQQLVTLMERKVGALGGTAVAHTGAVTATAGIGTNTLTAGSLTTGTLTTGPIYPSYSAWGSTTGAGGAAMVNDNNVYRALMLVGNDSGGGVRKVRVFDDLQVEGQLNVGNLRCRTLSTACSDDGGGNALYFDRHNVACAGTEFLQQWRLQRCNTTTMRVDYTCCRIGT